MIEQTTGSPITDLPFSSFSTKNTVWDSCVLNVKAIKKNKVVSIKTCDVFKRILPFERVSDVICM